MILRLKYIGFVKENTEIKESVKFRDLPISLQSYDEVILNKIKFYLENGQLVFGWMGYSVDPKTKQIIAPDSYLTDGEWIWPNYYYYYIEKYHLEVDPEFIEHMEASDFNLKPKRDLIFYIKEIEFELSNKINSKF